MDSCGSYGIGRMQYDKQRGERTAAEHALRIAEIAVARHFLLLQTLRQLAVFAIHCADNTYRHAC